MRQSLFGYLEGGNGPDGLKLSRKQARHEAWSESILPADTQLEAPEGETSRRPLMVFGFIGVLALGALVVRLFLLQIVGGGDNLALANGNRIRERVARAPRGMIYDRNHVVLARNQASYDLTVVPQQLPVKPADRSTEYGTLAGIMGVPAATLQAKAEAVCATHDPACMTSPVAELVISGIVTSLFSA
jgi:Penicillin-binding Protein dimerisation domain